MEWAPPGLTSGRNLGNSTFACTVQWCMQICHKPLSPSVQDQKLWNRLPRLEKDLNSFLSSGSKVVEWSSQGLTSHGHFWNSTFACTVQWCMQICHKPFSHQLRAIKDINVNLSFLSCGMDPCKTDISWTFLKFYFCMYCHLLYFSWTFLKFYFCMYCPKMYANLP